MGLSAAERLELSHQAAEFPREVGKSEGLDTQAGDP